MSMEAMKLALEALRETETYNTQNREQYQLELDAMEALRAAIEQAEKQKPVGCVYCVDPVLANVYYDQTCYGCVKRMSERPQREWQGLTDAEIFESLFTVDCTSELAVARAIEAKLKEKNA